jgi:hypothetical protein
MDAPLASVLIALVGFVAFYQWLRFQRRGLIHRERLAALEKGLELPPLDREIRRSGWNVQRILLLAGLLWISVGIGAIVVLNAILANPSPATSEVPQGIQWIGIPLIGIGLSHLIVFATGRKSGE